jgi:hypothetical protein
MGQTKLNKQIVRISKKQMHYDTCFVDDTIQGRILMVWPITKEVLSLSPRHDAERRLQRHVTLLTKRRS